MRVLKSFSIRLVMLLFTSILFLLCIMSIVSTCHIDSHETAVFSFRTAGTFLCFLFILLLGFFSYKKRKALSPFLPSIQVLLVTGAILATLFVCFAKLPPKADQAVCLTVASQMHSHDYQAFKAGGYMQTYPQQTGLVLTYYLFMFLTGPYNYIALQLLNVLFYVGILYLTYAITKEVFDSVPIARLSSLGCLLFVPFLFYNLFIYGTMPGLFFSFYALLAAIRYIRGRSISNAGISAISISVAVLLKKNFLIFLIAVLLVLAVDFIHSRCKKDLLFFLLALLCTFSLSKGATGVVTSITKTPIGDGIPSIAWAAMGLQEGRRADGWYNSYSLFTYQDYGCDADATSKDSKEAIRQRLSYFASHPSNAASFFLNKTDSQWNEPSFQCFYINSIDLVDKDTNPFYYKLLNSPVHIMLLNYFDVFLSLLYFGCFLYGCSPKIKRIQDLSGAIVFLGGFFFHLVWEAKGQYTICYVLLLFPYCVRGYAFFFQRIEQALEKHSSYHKLHAALRPLFTIVLLYSCFFLLSYTDTRASASIKKCNKAYASKLSSSFNEVKHLNGTYRIKAADSGLYLTLHTAMKPCLSSNAGNAQQLRLKGPLSSITIIERSGGKLVTPSLFSRVDTPLSLKRKNIYHYEMMTTWQVTLSKDGSCRIMTPDGYALTHDGNGVQLTPSSSQSDSQTWLLERL